VAGPFEQTTLLEAAPTSAGVARRFVTTALDRWGAPGNRDVLELLTSELVTNAILHARTAILLTVCLSGDRVRVNVTDQNRQPPVRRWAKEEATSGRGLELVEALAVAWGVSPDDAGKVVWFEVAI